MTNVVAASGAMYMTSSTETCCANNLGRAWLDWPFVLQRNFGTGADDPLFVIKTSINDSTSTGNPFVTFNVNRCAVVRVFFGEEPGPGKAPPYPSWLNADNGWACSVTTGGGGTVATFAEEAPGTRQINGPFCTSLLGPGGVVLGPREGQAGSEAKMYTIFIQAAKTQIELDNCP